MRYASRTRRKSRITHKFLPGHWTFLGPGSEKRWYGSSYYGQWDRTANKMVPQFKETGHTIFTATSALSRGILKRRNGKSTIHFNGDFMNTELLFQTINSVNQVRIYAAVTNWRKRKKKHTFPHPRIIEISCCGTRRSGYVDVFSQPSTGKLDDAE